MKILKVILLIVFTFWLIVCTAYCSIQLFGKPLSIIISALSGVMIGYYLSILLKGVMSND